MTREQMIDTLEDYCNGNICDSCEFCNDCEKEMVFSEIVDEKQKHYVSLTLIHITRTRPITR